MTRSYIMGEQREWLYRSMGRYTSLFDTLLMTGPVGILYIYDDDRLRHVIDLKWVVNKITVEPYPPNDGWFIWIAGKRFQSPYFWNLISQAAQHLEQLADEGKLDETLSIR